MTSDMLIGVMSDYAGRVAEFLAGASREYKGYSILAQRKLLGDNVMVIGPNDPVGYALAETLRRRSQNVDRGAVLGGGDVTYLGKDDLPEGSNN